MPNRHADPRTPSEPRFFENPPAFRRWLQRHHVTATELWVGFHRKASGRPSLTWPESVDEALCFGWIDGIRKRLDPTRYVIRFTPRRPDSAWSSVNLRRVEALTRKGRMQPAGLRAFAARDPRKSGIYSFERAAARLDAEQEGQFRAQPDAWRFFESQPPGYRRTAIWWIVSARRPATRARRLATLIADSAAGRRLGPLQRTLTP